MYEKEEQKINLLELIEVVVKRKVLICTICGTAVVVAIVISLLLPNYYAATAKVLPPQKEEGLGLSSMLSRAGGLAGIAAGGLGGGSDLYVGILKSRSVEDAVVKRLNLFKNYQTKNLEQARKKLEGAVKFQAEKDGIISITAEDLDPKLAAQIANTIVDELGKTTVRLNLTTAGNERFFLEKRLAVVKEDLSRAEDDLRAFSQANKIVEPVEQAKVSIEAIARLKAELANKEVQLSVLSAKQTDQSPEVKTLKAAIESLKGEVGARTGSETSGGAIPSIGKVPGIGLEYARKLREVKTQEAIFEQLMKQFELAKLNEAKDSSSLQILDDAVIPTTKSRPRRSLIVILAAFTSFTLSLFLTFALEYLARLSEEDKTRFLNIKKQITSLKAVRG